MGKASEKPKYEYVEMCLRIVYTPHSIFAISYDVTHGVKCVGGER